MSISDSNEGFGDGNSEVLDRFKAIIAQEAVETKKDAISTAKLAISIYRSGEKELALLVIKESIRIAKSYIELSDKIGEGQENSYELLLGLETIEELMKSGEKAEYLKGILAELA
ncbi:MAG: hypothetical protein JHC28_06300 [Thermoprotei archaeon]|nr:hypothetical protein [Thermoprotei archaeon]